MKNAERAQWLLPLYGILVILSGVVMPEIPAAEAQNWTLPAIDVNLHLKHPMTACTPEELERLRAAYRGTGPEQEVVAETVTAAEKALATPLEFPPRGGQHNQWYQCDTCQMGLKTVDDTRHSCPKCGTVYTGEPYDDVIYSRKHGQNLGRARACAWAWALTGEKKYARFTADVLLGYAERYMQYPYHNASRGTEGPSGGRILEQSLSEASLFAVHIAPAYDLLCLSGVLDDAEKEKIREGLLLPMMRSIDAYKVDKGNWQTWHNAAMIAGGAVIGDASWVKKALADPNNGFAYQMEVSVSEEGMWYENSWGYHYYTLGAMARIAESARRLGIDIWSHPRLRAMFTLPLHYTMADGSLPRFGDSVNTHADRSSPAAEAAYAATRDPLLLSVMSNEPSWESILHGREMRPESEVAGPELDSRVFRSAGHAILRAGGPAGMTAAISFSPFGGFHAHFDKLGFVLFSHERELAVDPGRARSQAYRLPIHGNWYRATLSHNTVMVDGKSQGEAGGRLESFASNDRFAAVIASTTEAYPGVRHRRMLLLTPEYAVVFDELDGGSETHRYDWLYHNRGTKVLADAAAAQADLSRDVKGAEYIQDALIGSVSADLHLTFANAWKIRDETALVDQGGVDTHLFLAGQAGTGFLTGHGPAGTVLDRVPMARVTRNGKRVCFAAVIVPVNAGEPHSIDSIRHLQDVNVDSIEVRRGAAIDVVEISNDSAFRLLTSGQLALEGRPEE